MVIPYTVSRYFTDTPNVKQLFFSMADPSMVAPGTEQIRRVMQSATAPNRFTTSRT